MTEPTLSVLARQRAEDAALCDELRAFWTEVQPSGDYVHTIAKADITDRAAYRIKKLNDALAEACHDRDKAVAEVERLAAALKPFAVCCDQIRDDEDDEEWAKFRLFIKDYRRALAAIPPHLTPNPRP